MTLGHRYRNILIPHIVVLGGRVMCYESHINGLNINSLLPLGIFLEVRSLDLAWWPDLKWP